MNDDFLTFMFNVVIMCELLYLGFLVGRHYERFVYKYALEKELEKDIKSYKKEEKV